MVKYCDFCSKRKVLLVLLVILLSFMISLAVSQSGITESDGKVTFNSPKKKNGGTFTFCVTDVVATGYTYNSGLNNETCDSITAP